MKYCPKCGNKLSAQDKFCDKCGTDVSQVPAAGQQRTIRAVQSTSAPVRPQNAAKGIDKLNRNRRIRNNCLIIAACVLFLTAVAMVFFTLQSSSSQKADQAAYSQNVKSLGFDKANDLSPEDTAGLAISFAHMHFKDDPEWNKAFDEAENGDLHIRTVPEYNFAGYQAKAPKGGAVYVINNDLGYVVSDVHHPSQAKITYISRKNSKKEVFFPSLAKKVKAQSNKKRVQRIVQRVDVTDQNDNNNDEDTDSSDDSEDSSSTSDDTEADWNDDKEAALADFMDLFGHKMKQKYEEYDGENSIKNNAGEEYPDDFDDRTFKLYSDDDDDEDDAEEIDIGWDPELKEDYDYHCVAIFNCNVGSPEQHITYLFCIHDDEPVALVDQTTNGDDCMVKETANKDVRNAFANIAYGKDADDDE